MFSQSTSFLFKLMLIAINTFVLSFILVYVSKVISKIYKRYDMPEGRHIHTLPTPRLGGLGFIMAFLVALAQLLYVFPNLQKTFFASPLPIAIITGFVLSFFVGLVDDWVHMRARHKLFLQILIASLTVSIGYKVLHQLPQLQTLPHNILTALAINCVSVFYLVFMQNAFNLIDGLDGLASSFAILVLLSLAHMFSHQGHVLYFCMSLLLAIALAAFLFFNWQPSKIFMGDSGSLSIGFFLACLALIPAILPSQIDPSQNSVPMNTKIFSLKHCLLLLAYPSLDCVSSMLRRAYPHLKSYVKLKFRKSPKANLRKFLNKAIIHTMQPDDGHFHHVLLKQLKSHQNVTCLIVSMVSIKIFLLFYLL